MPKQGSYPRNRTLPNILLVDDNLEDAEARALTFRRLANAKAMTPGDVDEGDLRWADVVLVDFKLTQWKRDDSLSLAERPENGVALAAVFRSHRLWESPVAFALHTGELAELSGNLKEERHLHSIARINNVEWVFSKLKAENQQPLTVQVVSLADAIHRLPKSWPTDKPNRMRPMVEKLLDIKKHGWRDQAWQKLAECHPPIHELSPPFYAITFVRWLLTSILPYPTFLWDFHYVAARMRVTPNSLRDVLQKDPKFAEKLKQFRYNGILKEFLGERWWSSGIEHFLWSITRGQSYDGDALRTAVQKLSKRLEPIALTEPVVVLDEHFRVTSLLADLSEVVELQPEDWPSFAARPWMKREVVAKSARFISLAAASFKV
jgi:hypothetical protein